MSKMISYTRPDGKTVQAYLAEPEGSSAAPGIVVLQEWWGLNEQIKHVADRFAASGYSALVPDLYRGKLTVEAEEAEHLMKDLDFADAAGQDVRGAVQYLKSSGSAKVGVTGFCMGGALTVLSSMYVPEADAAAIWYGYPPLDYIDASKIHIPLIGHWATRDDAFPIAGVDTFEEKLTSAGVTFDFFRYDAKHAFANEEANAKNLPFLKYEPAAAELAWQRTLDFFSRQL